MLSKQSLAALLVSAVIAGCGGGAANQAALPGDGTYDDTILPANDGTQDFAPGSALNPSPSDPIGLPSTPPVASGAIPGTGTMTPQPNAQGFTLRGLVSDLEGRPLAKAKVSIGPQTTLTNAEGTFEFTGIMDSQIWVDVTADGFKAISRHNVVFSSEKPLADKEFKLSRETAGGTGESGSGPRLRHEGTFGGPAFKSVASLTVYGNRVYVLGVIDKKFWFDRAAVVVYNAATGDELSRIGDSVFSKMPKAASSLAIEAGQVVVADGTNRYTFNENGTFVKKAPGSSFALPERIKDESRDLRYTISAANKVKLEGDGLDVNLELENVNQARAIALGNQGNLLVLDGSSRTVHQFSLTTSGK
ncbi:MAG: carboxypeptidase-like regulatory domain-containing protein [Candidatus Sericytochromatia bacterium]|nr:carboxypeptidase-like regulatory domain-containing protein [Candidatus Sericytochromatia bacterium]